MYVYSDSAFLVMGKLVIGLTYRINIGRFSLLVTILHPNLLYRTFVICNKHISSIIIEPL